MHHKQKNILIGNGINIKFGGADQYSNQAILRRMFNNIRKGSNQIRNGAHKRVDPGELILLRIHTGLEAGPSSEHTLLSTAGLDGLDHADA